MQRPSLLGACAMLLAGALALPWVAAAQDDSGDNAASPVTVTADRIPPVVAPHPQPSRKLHVAKVDRKESPLRPEYRDFSARLQRVDLLITKAEKNGSFTTEEAAQHHADVATIRVQFKLSADKTAEAMSPSEKAKMDFDVKVQEKSVIADQE